MIPRFIDIELREGARRPFKKHDGDAGWDLYVSRPCDIPPGETMDVHTDVRIDMPVNLYARITGRSSSLRKLGLLVNEGIIDNGYTGELFVCVHNMTDKVFHVEKGMRLAQVLFHQIEDIRWCEVDHIEPGIGERGDAGFGSTGR